MGRKEVYRYTCRTCSGYFETEQRSQAYCRGCIQAGFEVLGMEPIPTLFQSSKWAAARRAQRLLAEADAK